MIRPDVRPRYVAVVYLVTVLIVGFTWLRPYGPAHYIATRTLQPNRLLVATDLKPPDTIAGHYGWLLPDKAELVGKYASKEITENNPVNPDDLREFINMSMPCEFEPAIVPLSNETNLLGQINAGASVDLYNSKGVLLESNQKVHGVICEQSQSPQGGRSVCYAVLRLPKGERRWASGKGEAVSISLRNAPNE